MRTILGITGTLAAGKNTAANYIYNQLHIPQAQVSDELKRLARTQKIPRTRENLINYSIELSRAQGEDILVKNILAQKDADPLMIVGMRQVAQIEYLKEHTNLYLIGIDANQDIRYEREYNRMRKEDRPSRQQFNKLDFLDNTGSVQNVRKCLELADIVIQNNGSLMGLRKQLSIILKNRPHLRRI